MVILSLSLIISREEWRPVDGNIWCFQRKNEKDSSPFINVEAALLQSLCKGQEVADSPILYKSRW